MAVLLTALLDTAPFRDPLAIVAFLGLPAALVGGGCGALSLKAGTRRAAIAGRVLAVVASHGAIAHLIFIKLPWSHFCLNINRY